MARYGGEEFLMVLPETTYECALSSTERLRGSVAESVSSYNGTEIRITASFGVAGFVPSPHNQETTHKVIIDRADRALYQAKNDGRNRVRGNRPQTEQLTP